LLIYYSLGVAYGKDDKYGFGLTAQYVDVPVSKFGLIVDSAAAGKPTPYYNTYDLESTLDLKDHASWTVLMGGWWRVSDSFDLGISGRVVPVNINLKGKVSLDKVNAEFPGDLTLTGGDAALDIVMPMTTRAGVRYRHLSEGGRELFDIELDYVYEGWSSIEDYNVKLTGNVNLSSVHDEGELGESLKDLVLGKKWRDTHSVRLGGTWNAVPDSFSVSLGGYWESGAVPNNYSNLDFLSFERFGMGSGIRISGAGLDFNLSYLFVMQEDRVVDEKYGKVFQARPLAPCPEKCGGLTGVPANAGKIESAYHQVNLGLVMHFDQWF
jgi:long-subunit fatty acid transport protein